MRKETRRIEKTELVFVKVAQEARIYRFIVNLFSPELTSATTLLHFGGDGSASAMAGHALPSVIIPILFHLCLLWDYVEDNPFLPASFPFRIPRTFHSVTEMYLIICPQCNFVVVRIDFVG